ncbi:hypothetical protein THASP1DRAFT_32309 [Thamnocephalis sphaerospora]|uniref:Nucleolus and neural progenitor protein-like N-terminal domain-containing protein n=1 Tax=Thamnocephalis sphaerospora TaxID=78915 RepID=A0A4P9XKQ7_9FUNG|nr:hypothetical protein THASP1DRAFT_32309 [Thamnocephalis sphaerospora]|eukprot:RKP05860.1 hypothetical protein THASP1DRAFT_32309 [Thamnocephalis sphaerospora]
MSPTTPLWNQRHAREPRFTAVDAPPQGKRGAAKEAKSATPGGLQLINETAAEHGQHYAQLRRLIRTIPAEAVLAELDTLEKVHQRNWNQHRRAVHYRGVIEVRRLGKRLRELGIHTILQRLSQGLYQARTRPNQGPMRWNNVPAREWMYWAAARCYGGIRLMDKMLSALESCHLQMQTLLSQTYFMSLALVFIGIVGRLWTLIRLLDPSAESTVLEGWEQLPCTLPPLPAGAMMASVAAERTASTDASVSKECTAVLGSKGVGEEEEEPVVKRVCRGLSSAAALASNTVDDSDGGVGNTIDRTTPITTTAATTGTSLAGGIGGDDDDDDDLGEIMTR